MEGKIIGSVFLQKVKLSVSDVVVTFFTSNDDSLVQFQPHVYFDLFYYLLV